MDDSSVSSTPYRNKTKGRLVIDSDDSDQEVNAYSKQEGKVLASDSDDSDKVINSSDANIEIPVTDNEDSFGEESSAVISEDEASEIVSDRTPAQAKPSRLSLLRSSQKKVLGNDTCDSVYLSFQDGSSQEESAVVSPSVEHGEDLYARSRIHKDEQGYHSEHSEIISDEEGVSATNSFSSNHANHSEHSEIISDEEGVSATNSFSSNHAEFESGDKSYDIKANTTETEHRNDEDNSVSLSESHHIDSDDQSLADSHCEENIESVLSDKDSSTNNAEQTSKLSHGDNSINDLKQTRKLSDGDNSINDLEQTRNFSVSDASINDLDQTRELSLDNDVEQRRNLSLVDLTQSDSSLQNSPVGATRQLSPEKRSVADIVTELSSVSNDVMVKEALLESISIDTLPDQGRNLKMKVLQLKQQKANLERELAESEEYFAQKNEMNQFLKSAKASVQSKLNFQPVKMEPRDHDAYASEILNEADDDDDETYSPSADSNASKMPSWGDLPNPDMTLSGFGAKAMQTHLTEKSLTVEALSKLHNALKSCPSEDTYAEDPKLLKVELMPHQKHGLAWMLWREQEKPAGGILADDMGLGKTLSVISLILKDIENKENSDDSGSDSDDDSPGWMSSKHTRMPRGGTLVVCPASLISQWEGEILKRVKRRALSVDLYHGTKRESKPRRLAKNDVVITTYGLVSRESGVETSKNCTRVKDKGPLFMIKWERIILDEAHMVRNHKSMMALGVCELVGKRRWCLTGTPIQNKELDLYALLKFLRCSPFDDLTVWKRWVDNKNAAGMQRLSTMMKSLMLRRTKEQLQEKGDLNCLPSKSFQLVDVNLDPEELKIYEKVSIFSSTLFAQFLHQRAEKQQFLDARYGMTTKPTWEQGDTEDNQFTTTEELAKMHRKMKGLTDIKTHQILVLLLRLRQICCHPGLIKKMVEDGDLEFSGGSVEDSAGLDVDLFNQMNRLNIDESGYEKQNDTKDKDEQDEPISVDHPVLSFDRPSAKIRAVLDLVQEKFLDTDDKAIIVSQWTSMLNIIEKFLKDMHVKYAMLTGNVPVDKRQEIVNAFNKQNSGPQVLLLSLTAGGVGLNLVGANHLLLVDIHWNPQLEAQACDRIYRVGQKKDVFIYRFITVNTIEERIKTLQDYKLTLAENVLTGTRNTQASKLTLDDLKMLFSAPSQADPHVAPKNNF